MNTIKYTEGEDPFDPNSPLSSMNNRNPFGVDASYFEEFGGKLNEQIADFEELKADAPFLASIPKYNPFEIPTGYFDELPGQLQNLITTQQPRFSIAEWLFQFIRPNFIFPVLTTIFIAVLAIQVVDRQAAQPKAGTVADLSIEEQLYPIDETTLVDLLSENKLENELLSSTDPIANYLIENNVDENVLNTDYNTIDHENK